MTQTQNATQEMTGRDRRGVNLRVRPRFGVGDLFLQLWRSLWLMILVFLPIAAGGVYLASKLPKEYTAAGRIQVSFDNQYVYDPIVGDAGRGASMEAEAIVSAEVEKANSPVLARRVLDKIGLEKVYPEIAEAMAEEEDPEKRKKIREQSYTSMSQDFSTWHGLKSPLVSFAFTHKDPVLAAEITNTFMKEYQIYRTELRDSSNVELVAGQSARFEVRLAKANDELRDFLVENNVGEFEAEREATAVSLAGLRDELLAVEARAKEAEGRLKGLRASLSDTPAEIDLQVESNGQQQLQELMFEREQLLLRYRPESRVVREIDARIAGMQNVLDEGDAGVRRRGPNPAYQTLISAIATTQSDVDAANSMAAELRRQVQEVSARQRKLISIYPEYKRLTRQRDVLDAAMEELATREQSERAVVEIAQNSKNSVTVVDYAFPPTKGSSMKMLAALASIMFAGFTALMVGLIRVFTRKGLSTRRSAEKTIGLPVIGATSAH